MGRTTPHALIKSLEATTALTKRRLVTYGAADGTAIPAVGSALYIAGVNAELDVAIGERASVIMDNGIADVEYGGNVTRGDPLTSDAVGRAVAVGAVAGTNYFIAGYAEVSGVLGDIGSINVRPGRIQG